MNWSQAVVGFSAIHKVWCLLRLPIQTPYRGFALDLIAGFPQTTRSTALQMKIPSAATVPRISIAKE